MACDTDDLRIICARNEESRPGPTLGADRRGARALRGVARTSSCREMDG
jgi:hypothetical protein